MSALAFRCGGYGRRVEVVHKYAVLCSLPCGNKSIRSPAKRCLRIPALLLPDSTETGRHAVMEEEAETEEHQRFSYQQRLKAAVHYTVGCLCEEVALDKEMQFSKQTIAAISELTFRQCENFAKDLETFARHAKRTTINTEDVKLLARRSNSLLKYITDKSEEIAQINLERKAQKKKKSEDGSKNSREPAEAGVVESEN
ncbi:hypothetical protein H8959_013242 [Pygathrix nigripes]